ncbi:hypothetical protein ABZX12_29055 [Kribbella sp. NPDC003505]|uniref:hypothetical protein n=1 Tax=Kribbella sp. NPDC003505 TaxID=3154448 RepID=UPI0033B2C689
MTQPAPGSHSANQQADEDDGRDLYDELTDALLYDPAIGRSTMMGYPCVRLAERFLASYDESSGSSRRTTNRAVSSSNSRPRG